MSSDIEDNWAPSSFPIPKHWKYVGIDDVFINLSLTGKRLAQKEYEVDGIYPVVDQGESLIGGYSSDSSKLISAEKSVVIFGDHTKRLKFIPFPFIPGADGIKVLCPRENVVPKYAFYACRSIRLPDRGYSRHFSFLKKSKFPLAPLDEQKHIVAKIEELFSELDNGIASLKTAREQLKVYRQAVLKHAFEGKLTAQWRKENADKLESPEQLLARIQQEREARYQQQLEDWKEAVSVWEANGKEGKKPGKPKKPIEIKVPTEANLPDLPKGWCWIEYHGVCEQIRNGISAKPIGHSGTKIFRISAVRAMNFNLEDIRFINDQDRKYDDYFLKEGDLVFTRYNGTKDYVGVCAEYKGDGSHLYPDKLIQTRIAVRSIKPSFLEKAISCGASRGFIERRIRTTAGQSGVSGSDIKEIPVPICSEEEQEIIGAHLAAQLSYIASMEAKIEQGILRAKTLNQSILKKAFSGQLIIDN